MSPKMEGSFMGDRDCGQKDTVDGRSRLRVTGSGGGQTYPLNNQREDKTRRKGSLVSSCGTYKDA